MKINKEDRNFFRIFAIYAILFVTYNCIVFFTFRIRLGAFWVSYAFMVSAFVAHIISLTRAFSNNEIETIFFGIPLASVSFYYLFAELFCSLAFMIFQIAGIRIAFLVQFIMLAAFSIIAIISLMARDTVQDINLDIKSKVVAIKGIYVDVEILSQSCTDMELKTGLKKLAETIKYSDPMTNAVVEDVEMRIRQKLCELRACCEEENIIEAKRICKQMESLLLERNNKLLISK